MSTASVLGGPQVHPIASSDQSLVEDIRLLGRILGEVIRNQEGAEAYAMIEQIRALSVAFRRGANDAAEATLKKRLAALSGEEAVTVIRAFTYFSHLANLAEDRHYIRQRTAHERKGDLQEGSIEAGIAMLQEWTK